MGSENPLRRPTIGTFSSLLIMVGAIASGSCDNSTKQLTEDERNLIINEVRQTLNEYYADIKEKGLTAEFDYLDSSDEFFWVPPGSAIPLSYDSIYRVLSQNAPMFKSIVSEWDTLRITPLTKDLASYTGRLRSTATDTSGVVSSVRLVETGLMIRRKVGWKLLSGQTSVAPE